jgi:hypothetical protein
MCPAWCDSPGKSRPVGSADFYPEERLVRELTVDGLWMDCDEVTKDRFAQSSQRLTM